MQIALYELTGQYLAMAEKLADLDLPDEVVQDTLESLQFPIEQKAVGVASFIKNLEANAEAIKEAEARMAQRRKAIENRAARIKHYLMANMQRTQITKIDSPYLHIAIKDNPPAVVIDALQALQDRYFRHPEPPPAEPDKKLIAQAIKDGVHVPGAHLERSQRLEIK